LTYHTYVNNSTHSVLERPTASQPELYTIALEKR